MTLLSTMASTLSTIITYSGAVISGLAVLENLLVIVVLAATSHLRIKYFTFVFNLALADLAFVAMLIAFSLHRARVLLALLQAFLFVSELMILAVAVHRYLALTITPPSRYDALVTRCRLVVVCLLLWCLSLALHLPIILVASDEVRLILSAWFRPPLVLAVWIATAVLYFFVFRKINRYTCIATIPSNQVVRTDDTEPAAPRLLQTRRLLVTFSIILVTSFICWTPYNIGQIMEYFIKTGQSTISKETLNYYNTIAALVYCLSPAINPLIYWWRLDGFRQGLKALFCRCLLQNQDLGETVDGNENQQNTETIM